MNRRSAFALAPVAFLGACAALNNPAPQPSPQLNNEIVLAYNGLVTGLALLTTLNPAAQAVATIVLKQLQAAYNTYITAPADTTLQQALQTAITNGLQLLSQYQAPAKAKAQRLGAHI